MYEEGGWGVMIGATSMQAFVCDDDKQKRWETTSVLGGRKKPVGLPAYCDAEVGTSRDKWHESREVWGTQKRNNQPHRSLPLPRGHVHKSCARMQYVHADNLSILC